MTDQATELRQMVSTRPAGFRDGFRTIAVTSGKGGVGKTSIALNVALALCGKGIRTALVDADLGLSNADVLMGLAPKLDIRDVVSDVCGITDILVEGPCGLKLAAGASGVESVANLTAGRRACLAAEIRSLSESVEVVVIDTAPGISDAVMDLVCSADTVLVVTTPEPTSLTDAYASAKVLLQRRPDADVSMVVNMADSRAHAEEIAAGFGRVTERFLGRSIEMRGFVCTDTAVGDAVRRQNPLVLSHPHSVAAGCIRDLARSLAPALARLARAV